MAIHIPFLSRLHLADYFALLCSVLLIALESLISVITLALPAPVINLCYRLTRRLFNCLSSPSSRRSRDKKKRVWSAIANASDFADLCELHGYTVEGHIVQTKDGYLLGLHRLAWPRGDEHVRVNARPGKGGVRKKVVYLHHGLMMNSDVWVCLSDEERCLPFALVERGYDVWLGNNRGNKYSKKCLQSAPTELRFWNFSMDQFAFHDIPDSIEYILKTTHQPSLSYIGFSQGTAQAFAALSIHPDLNDKVDVFIALAPAMSPKGLTSRIVDTLVKASPNVLFLAFGRRAILGSATMWQSILYPPIFVRLIDTSLRFLFGWTAANISPDQKLAAYPHLYSFTSTKSVVHWFQIIRNGVFQMYDDEAPSPLTTNAAKYYRVAKFPTRNIKTPIVLVYGGSDSLVDINVMLRELPRHTVAKEIGHYEHLDFLWAATVDQLVFPHVFDALGESASGAGTKETHFRSPARRYSRPSDSAAFPEPEEDDAGDESAVPPRFRSTRLSHGRRISPSSPPGPQSQSSSAQYSRIPFAPSSYANAASAGHPSDGVSPPSSTTFPPAPAKVPLTTNTQSPVSSRLTAPSQASINSKTDSKPEAWWSSDEVPATEHQNESAPSTPLTPEQSGVRQGLDSHRAETSVTFGATGITPGLAKAKAVDAVEGKLAVRGEGVGSGMRAEVINTYGKVEAKTRTKRKIVGK